MELKNLVKEIAFRLSQNSIAKNFLGKPYRALKKREAEKKLENFHKYGLEALNMFNKCLTEHNFKYSLAFGSLLGAVREHGFIPHDDDIDVTMWIGDYRADLIQNLESYGFKHKISFSVKNDLYAKEDTFEYKGVLLDIFYVYKDEKNEPYCCYFETQPGCATRLSSIKKYGGLFSRKIKLPISDNVSHIDFLGIDITIPTNYDEVLKSVFGENYMTPVKGFSHKDYSEAKPEWLCEYKEF